MAGAQHTLYTGTFPFGDAGPLCSFPGRASCSRACNAPNVPIIAHASTEGHGHTFLTPLNPAILANSHAFDSEPSRCVKMYHLQPGKQALAGGGPLACMRMAILQDSRAMLHAH